LKTKKSNYPEHTFAKSSLRDFPFANVWLLAKEIFKNTLIHASMIRDFMKIALAPDSYMIALFWDSEKFRLLPSQKNVKISKLYKSPRL